MHPTAENLLPRFRYPNRQQASPPFSGLPIGSDARIFPTTRSRLAISGTQTPRFSGYPSIAFPPLSSCLPFLDMALLSMPPSEFRAAFRSPPVPPYRPVSQRSLGIGSIYRTSFAFGATKALTPAVITSTTGLPAYLAHTSQRSASNMWMARISLCTPIPAYPMLFRLRPLLASSPPCCAESSSHPVAPHPASLRRSFLQLRGLALPRHGLPPCCVCALTGAPGAGLRPTPTHDPARLPREHFQLNSAGNCGIKDSSALYFSP